MSNYLALGTKEEGNLPPLMRVGCVSTRLIRPSSPEEADELEKAATELESAIERRESAASKTNG